MFIIKYFFRFIYLNALQNILYLFLKYLHRLKKKKFLTSQPFMLLHSKNLMPRDLRAEINLQFPA